MERHGDEMVRLVIAATLLHRDKVQRFASDIASEPRLTRPLRGEPDDVLNSALPEKFFVLQDELRERAKALAQTARGTNNDELAAGVGLVLQTCVRCHSAFLEQSAQ